MGAGRVATLVPCVDEAGLVDDAIPRVVLRVVVQGRVQMIAIQNIKMQTEVRICNIRNYEMNDGHRQKVRDCWQER
eukprot:8794766-Pyramimonas_sp.AAC.1